MTSFANCGNMQQTLLTLFMFAVLLPQLFLTIEDAADRRCTRFFVDGFLLLAELFYLAVLFAVEDGVRSVRFFRFPVMYLWILEAVLFIYAGLGYIRRMRSTKYVLSRKSIKEGSDNLPDGICFFDERGTVRLINRKMMSIGVMLFGKEIQTLDELHTALSNPLVAVERLDKAVSLYRFPDGTVRRFAERTITDRDGETVTEVIATDVTELYVKQAELNVENARLADVNRRMKWLLDNMSDIVREEEILSMKIRVHDEIGHGILSAKKVLLQQQDIAVIREKAALWETAVDLLYRANNMPPFPDEWETVEACAEDLGVEIELDGEMPEQIFQRHLLILAVRECLTNCVRHAGGSRIFVALDSGEEGIACVITNNGIAPKGNIIEGGGLSGLRRRIEREGGTMKLQSSPRFSLTVTLPSREI